MSASEDASERLEEAEPELPSASFISDYHDHLEDTRQHLTGSDTAALLDSSNIGLTYWTSDEKGAFFRGLSVHSRLRPDLIASDIGTKNVVEVTTFIDMLEDAIAEEAYPRSQPPWSDQKLQLDWRTIPRTPRNVFPIAMEMSADWCQLEAKQAASLILHEPQIIARATERTHEAEVEKQRLALRRKRGAGKTEDGVRDRAGEKAKKKELEAWVEEREREWELDGFRGQLDGGALAAMDAIIRDEEDQRHLLSHNHPELLVFPEKTEDPNLHALSLLPEGSAVAPTTLASVVSDPDFDIEMIDPSLREADSTGQPNTPADIPLQSQPRRPLNTPSEPNTPPFAPVALPEDAEDLTPRQRERSAVPDSSLADPSDAPDPNLSPASRRRIYKRMYMRRKRAEKAGTAINQSAVRLKPGRKAKAVASASADHDVTPTVFRHPNKSGLTQPYKARAAVNTMGFTAGRIRDEGYDLFRLANFHKLMR